MNDLRALVTRARRAVIAVLGGQPAPVDGVPVPVVGGAVVDEPPPAGFWSVGITISLRPGTSATVGPWGAEAAFSNNDGGFPGVADGVVRLRRSVHSRFEAVDALAAQVAALGIVWWQPTIYFDESAPLPAGWREMANELAVRQGWTPYYKLPVTTRP